MLPSLLALAVSIKEYNHQEMMDYYNTRVKPDHNLFLFSNTTLEPFTELASTLEGLCKFSYLNSTSNPKTIKRFGINEDPMIILFHPQGVAPFKGDITYQSLFNFVAQSLPRSVEDIDEGWLDLKKPHVMLFMQKVFKPPALYAALASTFRNSGIRFGYSYSQDTMELFGIDGNAALVFSVDGAQHPYHGEFDFIKIRDAISSQFSTPTFEL